MQAIELTENSTKIEQKRTKTVQKQDLHTIQINESTCEYKNTVQKKKKTSKITLGKQHLLAYEQVLLGLPYPRKHQETFSQVKNLPVSEISRE